MTLCAYGCILYTVQCSALDEWGKPRPIGYNSKTFNDAEWHYDIYNKELTVVDCGLANWRHLLLGNNIIIHSDHANLTYYRHLHKLSNRAKHALNHIMQYSFVIKHKLRILNWANALSRHPDYELKDNFTEEIGLPSHIFVNTTLALNYNQAILNAQCNNTDEIQTLRSKYPLTNDNDKWTLNHCLVVVGNNDLKRGVITLYHNFPTAGHAGGWKTLFTINWDY